MKGEKISTKIATEEMDQIKNDWLFIVDNAPVCCK